jgi:hypothetical protein
VTEVDDPTDLPTVTIAKGLAAKPAYLLIFGVSFVFATGSGAGFTIGLSNSAPLIALVSSVVFVISLIASLITAYKSINVGEQQIVAAGDLRPKVTSTHDPHPTAFDEGNGNITIAFPGSLDFDLENATETLLFGIHQSHILIRYYNVISEKLRKGLHIRVLLLDPKCESGVHMTAMRFPGQALDQQELSRVESSLSNYAQIQKEHPKLIEIRVIPFLLPYGGFMFNWSTDEASVYIQRYTFRVQGGALKPKFFHKGSGSQWLQLYRAEILAMWEAADPLTPNS